MPKINQNFIAESLNLSATTISRCFTNHPKINPETRAKVMKFAVEHGYRYSPNRTQKVPSRKQPGKIAVLVGISESHSDAARVAGLIFTGMTQKAASLDYRLNLFYVDPRTFSPRMRSHRIIEGSFHNDWAGLILIFPFQKEAVKDLSKKFHIVSALDDYDDLAIDSINPDHELGISMMTRHLAENGHRRIGFFSWQYQHIETPWVEKRLGTYVGSLYRLGIPFCTEDVLMVPEAEARDLEAGAKRVLERMDSAMTGLVCAADHQAYQLIKCLQGKGIRIPGDLSITGYDGIPSPLGLPGLTTYSTPFRDLGNTAIVSLQRRIDHPVAGRSHILIDGELIPGETCQPLQQQHQQAE